MQHEHCKLKAEKEKLEKNLDDIISMYAEKQRLLKALMEVILWAIGSVTLYVLSFFMFFFLGETSVGAAS